MANFKLLELPQAIETFALDTVTNILNDEDSETALTWLTLNW